MGTATVTGCMRRGRGCGGDGLRRFFNFQSKMPNVHICIARMRELSFHERRLYTRDRFSYYSFKSLFSLFSSEMFGCLFTLLNSDLKIWSAWFRYFICVLTQCKKPQGSISFNKKAHFLWLTRYIYSKLNETKRTFETEIWFCISIWRNVENLNQELYKSKNWFT